MSRKNSINDCLRRQHLSSLIERAEDKKEMMQNLKNYCATKYGTDSFVYDIYRNKTASSIEVVQRLKHSLLKLI